MPIRSCAKSSLLFLPAILLACALSTAAQQPMQERTLLRSNPNGKFMLSATAGLHASASDRPTKRMWLGPVGGLALSWQMAPRWSLQAEARRREVRGYDFRVEYVLSGMNALGYRWHYIYAAAGSRLQFTEFPVVLKRARDNGHSSWFVGTRPALVKARGNHYGGSISVKGVNLPDYSPLYTTGFRRWDVALTLGFEARLWRNLWLDARYSQGFLDLTHDDYFLNTVTDVSSDAQLTLRYRFWRF